MEKIKVDVLVKPTSFYRHVYRVTKKHNFKLTIVVKKGQDFIKECMDKVYKRVKKMGLKKDNYDFIISEV